MGGSKSRKCNELAKSVWAYCIGKNMWISAAHIPGKTNLVADKMSRYFNDNTEWKLCPTVYHGDPGSIAIDAFSVPWSKFDFYAFPPFSIIGSVIRKIIHAGSNWDHNYSTVANTVLVPTTGGTHYSCSSATEEKDTQTMGIIVQSKGLCTNFEPNA
eukprot:gene2684-3106_t